MILTAFHGFCMALADSVPGVSGGTIAFILGFCERFLDALHGLFRGTGAERKAGLLYLLKLGLGWDAGMAACVVLLSGLFARNIYFMSSLFLGLTACSIPFVALSERKALLVRPARHGWFLLLGVAIMVGLTLLRSGTGTLGSVSYTQLSLPQFGYLFLSGAVAITAMVLPGISGSSILLIAGVYLPTIQAVHRFLRLQFDVVPGLCALGLGVLAGVGLSIHAIRAALRKYRGQTVWLILGLMLGSLYAIANGPASLDPPLPPMDAATFQVPAFLLGVVILLALEFLRNDHGAPGGPKGGESVMSLDWTILHGIHDALTCPFLDFLMPKITALGNGGAIWLAAAGGMLRAKKYRKQGVLLLGGLAAGVLVGNVFLKNVIARPRPCWLESVPLLIANPADYSFPSGHTLSSIIGATILTRTDRRFGWAAISLAALIAFSRLYLYVHFPSDILGAVALGVAIGELTFRQGGRALEKAALRRERSVR